MPVDLKVIVLLVPIVVGPIEVHVAVNLHERGARRAGAGGRGRSGGGGPS